MSNLRELREWHGLSREQLAARMGVRPEVIARWEAGDSSPNDRQRASLARIFGVSPNAIGDPESITPRPDLVRGPVYGEAQAAQPAPSR